MLRSLYSGVTGLKSHQTKLDSIGNNIANVNTLGYRSKTVNFSDVLYQTASKAAPAGQATSSTNAVQIGLGSRVASVTSTMGKEGSTQVTGNQLDMRISGQANAFFVVKDGNETYYTRDGAFGIDADRNLVLRSNGAFVQGWPSGTAGGATSNLTLPDPKSKKDLTYDTGVDFKGNINVADEETLTAKITQKDQTEYTINFRIKKIGEGEDSTYKLIAESVDVKNVMDEIQNVKLWRDNEFELEFNEEGAIEKVNGGKATYGNLSVPGKSTITLGFENITVGTGAADIRAVTGGEESSYYKVEEGNPTGYEVSGDGVIYSVYSNGMRDMVGKIATASFSNPTGLMNTGENLYQVSQSSGDARLEDIGKLGGSITSGALEMSNVDLAAEMTDLIVDQRGFQANSKVITTSDEMLQTLRDLKR